MMNNGQNEAILMNHWPCVELLWSGLVGHILLFHAFCFLFLFYARLLADHHILEPMHIHHHVHQDFNEFCMDPLKLYGCSTV